MCDTPKVPEVGGAHAEIEQKMHGRLDALASLIHLRETHNAKDDVDARRLDDLGVEFEGGDPLEDQAERLIDEYPLHVETTTVFEVVLGTGGPDDRLLFECSQFAESRPHEAVAIGVAYEIRRVLYRYSWGGGESAERVLSGDDRKTAEELARRVVPELA